MWHLWHSGDPNPEPLDCRSSALPIELECQVFIGSSAGCHCSLLWKYVLFRWDSEREMYVNSTSVTVWFQSYGYPINRVTVHRLLTVASVCLPFYAEVLLTYISRSLSQRNNTYFQSKEQWHPADDPINTWHSSSIGRALDRQSGNSTVTR